MPTLIQHHRDRAFASACRPVVEMLEHRQLLSASLDDAGLLTVEGTPQRDVITVRNTPGDKTKVRLVFNGQVTDYARDSVKGVKVDAGAGHDRVSILGLDIPATLIGGAGNDLLSGGAGNDLIQGGIGSDLLAGGKGDDILEGGTGKDTLTGDAGKDRYHGGAGDDRIVLGSDTGELVTRQGRDAVDKGAQAKFPTIQYLGTPAGSYTPAMIRNAYSLGDYDDPANTNKGRGQAIAIIAPHHSPFALRDMNIFALQYKMPTLRSGQFKTLYAAGKVPTFNEGWNSEAVMDLQMARIVAPDANLILVEAMSSSVADLQVAYDRAVNYLNKNFGGGVISSSFGLDSESEEQLVIHDIMASTRASRISFVTATGEALMRGLSGDVEPNGGPNTGGLPGTSPYETTVGGSTLYLDPLTGNRVPGFVPGANDPTEALDAYTDWSDDINGTITGAGAIPGGEEPWYDAGLLIESNWGTSSLFEIPAYQVNRLGPGGGRATPDVVWSADTRLGAAFYNTAGEGGQSGWFAAGGTSAAAPSFAGLLALVNQRRKQTGKTLLGNTVNQRLYRLGARGPDSYFNDIDTGALAIDPDDPNTPGTAPATQGWDNPSGWGSPNGNTLIPALADEPQRYTSLNSSKITMNGSLFYVPPSTTVPGEATGGFHPPITVPPSFNSIFFNGKGTASGINTYSIDAIFFGNYQVITPAAAAVGGTTTTTYDLAMYGVDSQTGEALAPVVDPNTGQVTTPGTPIRLYRYGNNVYGSAIFAYMITTTGGGGGADTSEGEYISVRFQGTVGTNGKISGDYFAVNPTTGAKVKTVFNSDQIGLLRGKFRS